MPAFNSVRPPNSKVELTAEQLEQLAEEADLVPDDFHALGSVMSLEKRSITKKKSGMVSDDGSVLSSVKNMDNDSAEKDSLKKGGGDSINKMLKKKEGESSPLSSPKIKSKPLMGGPASGLKPGQVPRQDSMESGFSKEDVLKSPTRQSPNQEPAPRQISLFSTKLLSKSGAGDFFK